MIARRLRPYTPAPAAPPVRTSLSPTQRQRLTAATRDGFLVSPAEPAVMSAWSRECRMSCWPDVRVTIADRLADLDIDFGTAGSIPLSPRAVDDLRELLAPRVVMPPVIDRFRHRLSGLDVTPWLARCSPIAEHDVAQLVALVHIVVARDLSPARLQLGIAS